jgi:PQQ-like domain
MNQARAGVQVLAFPAAPKPKRSHAPIVLLVAFVLAVGFACWYYFFGRKPRVVLSLPVAVAKDVSVADGCWPVGEGQFLLLSNGEAKLVDFGDRKTLWAAKVPPQQLVDERWQAAINARFVKLQQRSEELAQRRATLKTAQETKAFNDDVARYQAEVVAVRAEAARPPAPVALGTPNDDAGAGELGREKQFGASEIAILEQRLKRRSVRMAQSARTIEAKRVSAKSTLQKNALKQEEAKHAALLEEQKADEKALRLAKGEIVEEEEAPAVEESEPVAVRSAHVFPIGSMIWIIVDQQAIALDRGSGSVKSNLRLAGPVRSVAAGGGVLHIVAAAGRGACQITKIATSIAPISTYAAASPNDYAVAAGEGGGFMPNIQPHRTVFGGGASLLRADIQLMERKVVPMEGIKASSEGELSAAFENSAAHSLDEMSAIAKLVANDAERARGDAKVWVDHSTYDVAIRRPLDATAPEWRGQLTGCVQTFSTATLDLVTAGTKLIAFDRTNKKLWEATLGVPVPIRKHDTDWDNVPPPCVEHGDRLYFADGAFLAAFEIATGKALWRVPSVGIRKIQIDGDGSIYILSDNLSTEALTYALDSTTHDSIPLTLKINPDDGRIIWQLEKYTGLWVSGNDVYVLREYSTAMDDAAAVFSKSTVSARIKVFKLSRGDGAVIWEWFQPRMPRSVSVLGKNVALFFPDELQIVHSIAL